MQDGPEAGWYQSTGIPPGSPDQNKTNKTAKTHILHRLRSKHVKFYYSLQIWYPMRLRQLAFGLVQPKKLKSWGLFLNGNLVP